MIRVWGRKTSSNVQAVMWCLGELGLAHDRIDLGHRYGGTDRPDFLARNPNGTIPVLEDGGAPIWETGAILRYLAALYGPESFWPSDPVRRSQVDMWADWAKINVAMAFTVPVFWQLTRVPAAERDPDRLRHAVQHLDQALAIAETRLSRQAFLAGPQFSLADVQLGHVLFRYFDIEIPRAHLPHLRAYYDALRLRPAFVEHVMLDYSELTKPS